jgi:hypothetical protein
LLPSASPAILFNFFNETDGPIPISDMISFRLGLKSWKLCKTLDIAMKAGLSFLVYIKGHAGVVSDFQGFEATRLGRNSSAAMVDFDLHLSVVSVDNVSPLRGRAAPLRDAVVPYRR